LATFVCNTAKTAVSTKRLGHRGIERFSHLAIEGLKEPVPKPGVKAFSSAQTLTPGPSFWNKTFGHGVSSNGRKI